MLTFHNLVESLGKGQDLIAAKASVKTGPEVECQGCSRRYRLGENRRLEDCPICGKRLVRHE